VRIKDVATDDQRQYRVNATLAFKKSGPFLFKQLPSGRLLSFVKPRLEEGRFEQLQVAYECTNSVTHKWGIKHGYGGDFTQSDTQGTARDILAPALPRLEKAGYPVVMHTHDEVVCEVPDNDWYTLDEVIGILCEPLPWADGLPIAATGFEDYRYRKG
jgi:DNA polymerase